MLGQVRQPDRLGLADDEAEDAVASRRPADAGPEFGVDPVGRKALEHPSVGPDHSYRRVPGADHLGGHLRHAVRTPSRETSVMSAEVATHEPLEPFLR